MKEKIYRIPGYEKYGITKSGKVWAYPNQLHNGIFRKILLNNCGYLYVGLTKDNSKQVNEGIHRLIAITFIENPNNYNVINHKDGNKLNNNIENLEWCTQSQNQIHAIKNRLWKVSDKHRKSASIQGKLKRKLTPEQVREIRSLYKKGEPLKKTQGGKSSLELAKMYGVSKPVILKIVKNETYKEFL